MYIIPDPQIPPSLLAVADNKPPEKVGIVGAGKDVVIQSVKRAFEAELLVPVFYGDKDDISACANDLEWDISAFEIVDASDEHEAGHLAAMAAGRGELDMLMKGQIHSDTYLKAILNKEAGLRTKERLTHVFSITFEGIKGGGDKPLLISDAAVNASPDFTTQKSIIRNAVYVAHKLGITCPKVAFLSATETANPHIPSSITAHELCLWAKDNIDGALFCGPLAFDLCISPYAANIKNITDPVAGHADIIIVPEITVGNALMKAMVHMMGACTAGVVMGAKVPVILTSRAAPPAARLASVALASLVSE